VDGDRPTRAELDREAWEESAERHRTYEGRYQEFCWAHHLDPEDQRSAVAYEEWYEEQHEV
jgi:hypothetical protein